MRRILPLLLVLGVACSKPPTAPDSVVVELSLRLPSSEVWVGEKLPLAVQALDQNGVVLDSVPVTWSIDAPSLAAIDTTPALTGLGAGQVLLTARSGPIAVHRVVTIHSSEPVQVWLDVPTTGLPVLGTVQLAARVTAELGHLLPHPKVTWSVFPSGVITVDSTGKLTAVAEGSAAVTARAGTKSATVSFHVPEYYPTAISLSVPRQELLKSDSLRITPSVLDNRGVPSTGFPVTWSSDHPEIVSVANGVVTGIAAGTATITATVGALTRSIAITVAVPVQLQLFTGPFYLVPGDRTTLTPFVITSTGSTFSAQGVTWVSSRPDVATISSNGALLAVAVGTADITATVGSFSATVHLTVANALPPNNGSNPPVGGAGQWSGISFIRRVNGADHLEIVTPTGAPAPGLLPPDLAPPGNGWGRALALSPDGVTLLYDCPGNSSRICWFRRDDGNNGILPLTSVQQPSWMPDGIRIAMMKDYSSLGVYDPPTALFSLRQAPFYTARPVPSPNGSSLMYQCDFYRQYDDPLQLCLMDVAGNVTLYKDPAIGFSWAHDGRVAYLRYTSWMLTTKSLVVEAFQSAGNPTGPGAFEIPGFDDATETAWSPDGTRLAVLRGGAIWLYDLPDITNGTRIAFVGGTTISSISWR